MIFVNVLDFLMAMAKIILVKRPSVENPFSFLSYLFHTKMQVDQAAKIITLIRKESEPISESRWQEFVLSSRGLYVKVMRKLRDLGMVEKELGNYHLSDQFSIALEKLAEFWRGVLDSNSDASYFSRES
jgi:predicted transcriptional regulator